MGYSKFSEEYIDRTKQIIEGYETLFSKEIVQNEGFEITLLLNCMMGLVAFTRDRFYESLPSINFNSALGKINGVVITDSRKDTRTVKDSITDIRNTMIHLGDSREVYVSKLELNDKDISERDDIGVVKRIKLTCGNKLDKWYITINLDNNEGSKSAFKDFLYRLCEIITTPYHKLT